MRIDLPDNDFDHLETYRDEARKYLPNITEEDRKQEAKTQTGPYFNKWMDGALILGVVAVIVLAVIS